jgi:hypothetical protein
MLSSERKAALILTGIAASEGIWVYFNLAGNASRFWRYTGFNDPGHAGLIGWSSALICALLFIWPAAQLPSVRQTLIRLSWLKLLGFLVAVAAGFCEELVFRKWLMDLMRNDRFHLALQIIASGLLFGVAHGVWGLFRGSARAAAVAVTATSILGFMLAVVYVLSHRIVAPCVLAHFLINLFLEPGLLLAAVRGEMGYPLRKAATGDAD